MTDTRVLISGLGLMGGSLAAALTRAGWQVFLHHRRGEVAEAAAARGWGTAVAAPSAPVAIVVVCGPVSAIPAMARAAAAGCPGAAVTDVGSTKASLVATLADLHRFVGSHPMAGSHRQGLDAADATLYHGRLCLTTPVASTDPLALNLVEQLWHAVGMRVVRLDPAEHDAAVAAGSHLPHLLASTAAACCTDAGLHVAASGFRDTTRIAAGGPELWADILLANRSAVSERLAAAQMRLAELDRLLKAGDAASVAAWLAVGRRQRAAFEAMDQALPLGQ